jgi:hypothetical protein
VSTAFDIDLVDIEQQTSAAEAWNQFAPSQANPANAVEYASFYRALGGVPLFLEVYRGGTKVAQWLVSRQRRRLLPFARLQADSAPQVLETEAAARDDIFVALVSFLKRRLWARELNLLKYSLVRGLSETALRRSGFADIVSYGSYVNALTADETLLAGFHDSHRRNTRKAMREAFLYVPCLETSAYLELSRQTYAPFDSEGPTAQLVEAVERALARRGRALFSAVYVAEELSAASIVLYHGHNAFYLHGASHPGRRRGATAYLHFENMRWLRARGVRRYDFGGARLDADEKSRSIATFKERFGGELVREFGGVYHWP